LDITQLAAKELQLLRDPTLLLFKRADASHTRAASLADSFAPTTRPATAGARVAASHRIPLSSLS
jgi:hypothetical protein